MSHITDIMKARHNISWFSDEIPDKKLIDDILKKAHDLVPHKNNFWYYRIKVLGPEHQEEKKKLAIASVCGTGKQQFRNGTKEDIDRLFKIYDEYISDENRKKGYKPIENCHFNMQVLAPYLLVYSQRPELLTETQKNSQYYKTGKLRSVFNVNNNTRSNMWLIQAGMHGIITSMLAVDKGLDASFCKCFFYNTHIHSNIMRKARASADNIAFTLGIVLARLNGDLEKILVQPKQEETIQVELDGGKGW